MYEKFGKSFKDIIDLKAPFFTDNGEMLARALHIAELYTQQPLRTKCKICDKLMSDQMSFKKHGVPYKICQQCGHLNGAHEDSDVFCEAIYTSEGGAEYAKNYTSADVNSYIKRRDAIYGPKVQFLIDVLKSRKEKVEDLSIADMGAGAGYFVSAAIDKGLTKTIGYEVSEAQVSLGNWVMKSSPIKLINLKDATKLCETLQVDVLTFIGVFEHLQQPREILAAINKNLHIKYVYICVPLFGPCIYNEMVFEDVLPRQLSGGHTHLFTKGSIEHFSAEFNLEQVGAWWFGTDMMDYYRSVRVELDRNPNLNNMVKPWLNLFEPLIDELQLVLDKKRESGQVHLVFSIRR